jgi:outer membrane protein OmpA-like peptidoglycan-associated protein
MSIHQTFNQSLNMSIKSACTACCVGLAALALTACSSPPKPPSVDESTKRPVNVKSAVELKSCEGDLSRATILVSEMARAGVVTTALARSLPLPAVAAAIAAEPAQVEAATNLVAVIPFGVGSANMNIDAAEAAVLVSRANEAALIMIRGRTDAVGDSTLDTALARRRAESAAAFLQQAGVPKDKLRLTWQGFGDPVAGLAASERGKSRRVELEFYASAPTFLSLRNDTASSKSASAASL